jgi:hypothetical protein
MVQKGCEMVEHIPSVGRIVHYVLRNDDRNAGQHRPAIITRVWDPVPHAGSAVQLQVFTDGSNDGLENVVWRTSVMQDATGEHGGSWHWPERV